MSSDEQHLRVEEWRITRRDALRGALAGGAMLSAGGLVAACDDGGGGGGTGGGGGGGTSGEAVRDGGTLRVGVSGGGAEDSIDAHVLLTDPDIARAFQLYEPLAIRTADYEPEMVLAESSRRARARMSGRSACETASGSTTASPSRRTTSSSPYAE
jgi:peptide/nickel transport system substrate-binding protein